MKKIKKIEYFLFIILLFFQNFAIIKTDTFGINGLVIFLLIISIFQFKIFYYKINIRYLFFVLFMIIILILGSFFNDILYITQVIKIIMNIWLIYAGYIYIKKIYKDGNQEYFWSLYAKVALIMFLYGIYEFIAIRNSLPLFLNVFNNNPSYYVRSVHDYFSGWNEGYRLYNVFFEPSAFSAFLVYNFFLIKENRYIKKHLKRILYILIIFNLVFTYARTGWVTMCYMVIIYMAYKLLSNNAKMLDNIFFLFPIINIIIMYCVGLILYTDKSSVARTYSAIYYLRESFDSIKSFLFGHGCGSIANGTLHLNNIDTSAHNGYCDIIYQYGMPIFIYLLEVIKHKIRNIKKHRYLIVGVIGTLCCFANYYVVETFIVLAILIIYCEEENMEEEVKK